jgi:hypothetical protein
MRTRLIRKELNIYDLKTACDDKRISSYFHFENYLNYVQNMVPISQRINSVSIAKTTHLMSFRKTTCVDGENKA